MQRSIAPATTLRPAMMQARLISSISTRPSTSTALRPIHRIKAQLCPRHCASLCAPCSRSSATPSPAAAPNQHIRHIHAAPILAQQKQTVKDTVAQQTSTTSSNSASNGSFDPSRLSGLLLELYQRGMIADLTHASDLQRFLQTPPSSPSAPRTMDGFTPRVVYAGFDPTAPSLHIGNLLVLMALRRFQQWGHKTICLVGGATGMIGDPSGRSTERNMMTMEQIERNCQGISNDMKKFLSFEDGATPPSSSGQPPKTDSPILPAVLLNNASWFSSFSLLPFLRDVGRHFRVSSMLARESVSSRLQSGVGLSFTELSYQILQAYDFAHLHQTMDASIQIGGSDQWGNITAGVELIKRQAAAEQRSNEGDNNAADEHREPQAFGITLPLLTTASGQKFGKSMGNAPIWLAAPPANASTSTNTPPSSTAAHSSPYQLYQYFLTNTADADAIRYLKLFTDLSLDEIRTLESEWFGRDTPRLCRILAEHVTRLVHGEAGLAEAQAASKALFWKGSGDAPDLSSLPSVESILQLFAGVPRLSLPRSTLLSMPLVELAVRVGMVRTKAEARRLIAGGGFYFNNTRVDNDARVVEEKDLLAKGRICVLRSGKKKQFVIMVADEADAQ